MQNGTYGVSWSGGKDSCMALYKAMQNGLKISHLVNFISDNPKKVRFHGTDADLIALQSQATGIPLFQRVTSWEEYERDFKAGISELKAAGLKGMVFGDIYLEQHLEWVQRVCGEIGIEAVEPLWHRDTGQLLSEFINLGFRAVIVCVKAGMIEQRWLGRQVDNEFKEYLLKNDIDPCGENGEYHTLVVGGPLFKGNIQITKSSLCQREGYYLLDIENFRLNSG